ncbi:hypothetical protein [Limosilactobacillus reuteri]|uniref:hypothetical protein n=1 Tax=Limosilactobacillus reuteri TaxID=1598 RepID=UPI002B053DDF|nr:hypothetical protein [Limosilactobacillus reuteri]
MKWLVEDFSQIALIRTYRNLLFWLIVSFAVISAVFKSVFAFLFPFEFIFFFAILIILAFLIVVNLVLIINARSELKGLDKGRTMKYTEFLQRRLRRAVASQVATGAESVQAMNAKKLNWLARQSYIVVDKKGQLAVVIRIGRDIELADVINDEMVSGILSYFAKISDTRFSESELVTIEHSILIAHYTSDYQIARLLK